MTLRMILQLIAFVAQEEDKTRVTEWINKNIVIIVDPRSRHSLHPLSEGVFYAYNLCHLAVKNSSRQVVQFLIDHCGADLSCNCLQVIAQNESEADLEPSDSLFSMILNTFHDPVEFLKELLNSGVEQRFEEGSQSRKTFTFGKTKRYFNVFFCKCLINHLIADFSVLCPPSSSFNDQPSNAQQMNVLNTIVNSSDDLHCVQYELLKHPLVGGCVVKHVFKG